MKISSGLKPSAYMDRIQINRIIPFKKKSVSKHKPLSRSYFKMIEIIHTFKIYFDTSELMYD